MGLACTVVAEERQPTLSCCYIRRFPPSEQMPGRKSSCACPPNFFQSWVNVKVILFPFGMDCSLVLSRHWRLVVISKCLPVLYAADFFYSANLSRRRSHSSPHGVIPPLDTRTACALWQMTNGILPLSCVARAAKQKHQRRRTSALAESRMSRYRPNQSRLVCFDDPSCLGNDLAISPCMPSKVPADGAACKTSQFREQSDRFLADQIPPAAADRPPGEKAVFANSRREAGRATNSARICRMGQSQPGLRCFAKKRRSRSARGVLAPGVKMPPV